MTTARAGPPLADIDWTEDGAPINRAFGDIYFSREDGVAETDYVFIEGCGLPAALNGRARFQTAELGFGLGLTTARLLRAWSTAAAATELSIASFEIAPAPIEAMARVLSDEPFAEPLLTALAARWPPPLGRTRYTLSGAPGVATLDLWIGDARACVPAWPERADAWFLDGHSPARNPDLWTAELMAAVFERTAPGGVFATYAAAGHVRRALAAAGFEVTRRPGFGRKREMLTGRRPG